MALQVGDLIPIGGGGSGLDKFPPPPIVNFTGVSAGDTTARLTWTNPIDSDFVGVRIQRKTGGYPASETDGITVYDGIGTTFDDVDLPSSTQYYYRAFTYDYDENFNYDSGQQVSVKLELTFDKSATPGPKTLLAGDYSSGYYGEVTSAEFITPVNLTAAVGLIPGIAQNTDTSWLKFLVDGKIILTTRASIRISISWNSLNAAGIVYGDKIITIGSESYRVRLFRGVETDPGTTVTNSEWNKTMVKVGPSGSFGVNITLANLGISSGNGSRTWCQEANSSGSTSRVTRGFNTIDGITNTASSTATSTYGWRPVLELVGPGEDRSTSPGAKNTIGGNAYAGFFGEVPSEEFITGSQLSTLTGYSTGKVMNDTTPWLKFISDGKILFSPKKAIRSDISYNSLNSAGLVFGTKTVVVGGLTYKVRLWRGSLTNPNNFDLADRSAIGSEWNKLLLPLSNKAPSNWTKPEFAGTTADWNVNYTDADLGANLGHYTACQEPLLDSTYVLGRGYDYIEASSWFNPSSYGSYFVWRPVLELVE